MCVSVYEKDLRVCYFYELNLVRNNFENTLTGPQQSSSPYVLRPVYSYNILLTGFKE